MNKLKKIAYILPFLLLWPIKTFAFCPLCVVATGFAVGLVRWLGVDDIIVGLWVGAFGLSMALLLGNFLVRKGASKKISLPAAITLVLASMLASLYLGGFLKVPNKIFGIEKIIFGMIIGILMMIMAPFINNLIKKLNRDENLISHQKMLVALALLGASSIIFYSIL